MLPVGNGGRVTSGYPGESGLSCITGKRSESGGPRKGGYTAGMRSSLLEEIESVGVCGVVLGEV